MAATILGVEHNYICKELIMSEPEYNTVRNLPLCQISDPKYFHLLREFAGHMAPGCVAEALMKWLDQF